ncbi:sensor histidine kinase [Streptosporangium sandarakinum]
MAALSAMAAAALMAGLWMRARRAYVTSLERDRERRARLAVAEERARMTRDMHDIVTHNLSVMVALADSAAYVRHSAPDRAAAAMEQIAATGRQALQDMRRSLGTGRGRAASGEDRLQEMLRPAPGIAELGPLAERMRAAGLATCVRVAGDTEAVPAAAQLTIYRLVQEALTNTLRHAPGARADVRVEVSSRRAEVEVTDVRDPAVPGSPGPLGAGTWASGPRSGLPGDGRGIAGMRERVAAYGGTLDAGPVADGGWRVLAVLDLGAPR